MQQLRLRLAVLLERDPPFEDIRQSASIVQASVQPIERHEDRRRVPRALRRLRESPRRARVVAQPLFGDSPEPLVEVFHRRRIEDADRAIGEGVRVALPPGFTDSFGEALGVLVEFRVVRLFDERP